MDTAKIYMWKAFSLLYYFISYLLHSLGNFQLVVGELNNHQYPGSYADENVASDSVTFVSTACTEPANSLSNLIQYIVFPDINFAGKIKI